VQQAIIDFISGLSRSITQGISEAQKNGGIGKILVHDMEKFRKEIFTTGVAISLVGAGFFLVLWGIASTIDEIFSMRGLGFVLIGLFGVLTGVLVYKK
jgi:hypothetical protein